MRSLLPFVRLDPPAPTVAVVFRDDNAMTPFKPRDRGKPMDMVAAYFAPHPDVNYIVLSIGRREFTYQVVFHEYTHLLVARLSHDSVPVWPSLPHSSSAMCGATGAVITTIVSAAARGTRSSLVRALLSSISRAIAVLNRSAS